MLQVLAIDVKSDHKETLCKRELLEYRLDLIIVLSLILFIFSLQSKYSFDVV